MNKFFLILLLSIVPKMIFSLVENNGTELTTDVLHLVINELVGLNEKFTGVKVEDLASKVEELASKVEELPSKADFDKLSKFQVELSSKVDKFQVELSSKVDKLSSEVESQRSEIRLLAGTMHNFSRQRIAVMESSTQLINFLDGCENMTSTVHSVIIGDFIAQIFTPHVNCFDPPHRTADKRDIYLHSKYDIGYISGCPNSGHALNITAFTTPSPGDEAISFGYGTSGRVWVGYVSHVKDDDCSNVPALHWTGKANVCREEIYIQGAQHPGMSGAMVANGCGYIGLAHAMVNNTAYGIIVPAKFIVEGFSNISHKFKTSAECPNVKIAVMPTRPFVCGLDEIAS